MQPFPFFKVKLHCHLVGRYSYETPFLSLACRWCTNEHNKALLGRYSYATLSFPF